MLKVGIIGCGAIGSELARVVVTRFKKNARLAYLCDANPKVAQNLKQKLKTSAAISPLSKLVCKSDFIIEAASQQAALDAIPLARRFKKKMLVMTVGALLRIPNALTKLQKGILYVPSGALAGVDALLAAHQGKITKVRLTTRKPLASLKDAPFFKKSKWADKVIRKPTVIFDGSAHVATQCFPQNINVAATLSLAGIGSQKTKVRIITSPRYKTNSHEIEIEGSFGRIKTLTDNIPSKYNPKTSALAIYSAIACLQKIFSALKVGT